MCCPVLATFVLLQFSLCNTFFLCTIQDSEKYVEELLTLFNRFSKLVREAFHDDPRFLTARDKAYKQVVNDTSVFKLDLPSSRHRYGGRWRRIHVHCVGVIV